MVVLRQTIWRDDPDDGVAAVLGVAFDCATATAQEALNRLQRDIVALRETDTERERDPSPFLSSPSSSDLPSSHYWDNVQGGQNIQWQWKRRLIFWAIQGPVHLNILHIL